VAAQLAALGRMHTTVPDLAIQQRLSAIVPLLYGELTALGAHDMEVAHQLLLGSPCIWVGNAFVSSDRVALRFSLFACLLVWELPVFGPEMPSFSRIEWLSCFFLSACLLVWELSVRGWDMRLFPRIEWPSGFPVCMFVHVREGVSMKSFCMCSCVAVRTVREDSARHMREKSVLSTEGQYKGNGVENWAGHD
jgi:hypothetical protein